MLDALLEGASRALETTSADLVGNAKGGAKVLSAEEVRDWGGLEADNGLDKDADDRLPSPPQITASSDDDYFPSEEEEDALAPQTVSAPAVIPL